MNVYNCRYGLVHDKPCIVGTDDGKLVLIPSSNNGWIYAAYLNAVREDGYAPVKLVFDACRKDKNIDPQYFVWRLPKKQYPPISRDEIIGMISLGYDPLEYGWFMYREERIIADHLFTYLKAIKALWKIRKEHRNYFWQTPVKDAFPIAMKLWWHDRHYVKKMRGEWTNPFYWLWFQLYAFATILQKDNISAQNVLWLQLKDIKSSWWIRFLNPKKNFAEYFPADHPVNNKLQ